MLRSQVLRVNFILIPVSFGLGLCLAGQYLQGIFAAALGYIFYEVARYFDRTRENKIIEDDIAKAKRMIALHEKELARGHPTYEISDIDQWIRGQKMILHMWQTKLTDFERKRQDNH